MKTPPAPFLFVFLLGFAVLDFLDLEEPGLGWGVFALGLVNLACATVLGLKWLAPGLLGATWSGTALIGAGLVVLGLLMALAAASALWPVAAGSVALAVLGMAIEMRVWWQRHSASLPKP